MRKLTPEEQATLVDLTTAAEDAQESLGRAIRKLRRDCGMPADAVPDEGTGEWFRLESQQNGALKRVALV